MKKIIVLLLIFLIGAVFSELTDDELANFKFNLDGTVEVKNTTLLENKQNISVKITLYNPTDEIMPLILLKQENGIWKTVKIIGALLPDKKNIFELEFEAKNTGESIKKTRYAVVAKDNNETTYGKYFEIVEDWREYKKSIDQELSNTILILMPLLGLFLVLMIIVFAQLKYAAKQKYTVSKSFDNYNMPTFIEEEKEEHDISKILMHPLIYLFHLIVIVIFLFFIYERVVERIGSEEGIKVFLLAGIGAFNIPFLYFLLSWYIIQKEEKKPIELFFAMFLWGMVSAFISFVVSSYFSIELYQINMIAYTIISVIILTPIIEETIKGIGVFLISGNKEYNDTLTGLLLGFSVGLGFAFIENWFYFSLKTNPFEMGLGNWTMFIFYRSFFNSLAHGCFTGFISAMIGYAKSLTKLSKFAKIAFMPGLIVAIAVHMVFNITAIIDNYLLPSEEYLFFIFNPMLIILLGAIFFMVLVFALVDEQKRKNEKVIK